MLQAMPRHMALVRRKDLQQTDSTELASAGVVQLLASWLEQPVEQFCLGSRVDWNHQSSEWPCIQQSSAADDGHRSVNTRPDATLGRDWQHACHMYKKDYVYS
jgi:hypothetical protein